MPENILTVCRTCHDMMDNSTERAVMIQTAEAYLREKYPDWRKEDLVYKKYPF